MKKNIYVRKKRFEEAGSDADQRQKAITKISANW